VSDDRYDAGARVFHWTVVALVAVTVPIGITMNLILGEGPAQGVLFVIHKSIGVTIFVLMLARLGWRLGRGTPPPSRDLSPLEIRASRAVHALLYLLLLAMAATGYVQEVAGGYPLTWFDLFAVPRLVAKNKALSDLAENAHLALQWAVYGLVAMHAGAALHHHFVRKNDVLARMLP
jgi:cytochrome b561